MAKKILQVNCVYEIGSTGKIISDIHTELLDQGYKSIICYGRGKKIKQKYVYKTCYETYSKFNNILSRINGYMYGGLYFSTRKLISIIKREKPDVVHLHCLNGYFVNIYKLITWLKENNINTVLTLHAEFMYTANCGYTFECEKWKSGCNNCPRVKQETKSILFDKTHESWKKMFDAFKGYNNIIITSVSPWLMNRATISPILEDKKQYLVLNGINTNIFKSYDTKELKKEMKLEDKKVILYVTANFSTDKNHIKGGYYILKLAEMLKNFNVQILVAGPVEKYIIPPENITFLGKVLNQELLAKYYSMADVTLLTSKKETFSMPVAESLCCGTPIIGFKAGAPEQIAINKYSKFIEYGDINALYENIILYLKQGKNINIEKEAREKYSKKFMTAEYIKIYNLFK